MITIGVRELKQRASELIRTVRENGSQIQVTYHGKVVALLIPVERAIPEREAEAWAGIDRLAAEVGAQWPSGVTAVDAVAESRR